MLSLKVGKILFSPEIFWIFLGSLGGLSLLVIALYSIQLKKGRLSEQQERNDLIQSWQQQLNGCEENNSELAASIGILKSQIDSQAKELQAVMKAKEEELSKKDNVLHNEIIAKERISGDCKELQVELTDIKNQLASKEKELLFGARFKQDMALKEEALKTSQEMYQGLKEQYDDLERQVDTLNQSLALEKTLHQRLREEHTRCKT